jgi:hypothetical protein
MLPQPFQFDVNRDRANELCSNGFCYLKNEVNQAVVAPGEDTIDLGVGCASGTVTFGDTPCTISCGQDSHGGDYTNLYTGNYLACASTCADDSNCVTAQYNEGNVSTFPQTLEFHVNKELTLILLNRVTAISRMSTTASSTRTTLTASSALVPPPKL